MFESPIIFFILDVFLPQAFKNISFLLGYYIMTIGGTGSGGAGYLDDVELTTLDPDSSPVPECLSNLSPLPIKLANTAGALAYPGKSV